MTRRHVDHRQPEHEPDPGLAPATVTTDTTAALTLLPTAQASVATAGTNVTTHIALLESLN
jgi:hypothetical protein